MSSPFTPNTEEHRKKMLATIGMDSVEDLFKDIPEKVRNHNLNLRNLIIVYFYLFVNYFLYQEKHIEAFVSAGGLFQN